MRTDEIQKYNNGQELEHKEICERLQKIISEKLESTESKIWHAHPVWFIDGNPIVGYSVLKAGVQLMFWSGRSFDEAELTSKSKFQDASVFYNSIDEVDEQKIAGWLKKSENIQWDYKNIVKRRGELVRLK